MKLSKMLGLVVLSASLALSASASASIWGIGTTKQLSVSGYPAAVVSGDYNGDGMPDLVTVFHKKNGSILYMQGDGKGGIAKRIKTALTGDPVYLVGGDFDKDGKLDVIVALFDNNATVNPGRIEVLFGKGDGTFRNYKETDPNTPISYTVGIRPISIVVADFNGDTNPDLAVANFDDGTITVFFGDGTGSFTTSLADTFACGSHPRDFVATDINGDGKLDLVVSNFDFDMVSIFYGDGTGHFSPSTVEPNIAFPLNSKPWGVAAADLDKDGRVDLAVTESGMKKLALLFQNSTTVGKFNPPVEMTVSGGPDFVLATDIDQDGTPDLIVTNGGRNSMTIFRGKGNRAFEPAKNFQTGLFPIHIVTADMNRDGDPDIITANINGSNLSEFLAKVTNKGTWGFAPSEDFAGGSWPAGLTAGAFTNASTVLADFSRDGKPDKASLDKPGGRVGVQVFNNLSSTFKPPVYYGVGNDSSAIIAADINRDGKPDIAVSDLSASKVYVLLGNGDGTLQAAKEFNVGLNPASMAIGDFGAPIGYTGNIFYGPNGYLDIAVAPTSPPDASIDTVSVLFGQEQFKVTIAVNNQSYGSVYQIRDSQDPSKDVLLPPGVYFFEANKALTLEARPADINLYKFTGWSGSFTGTQNPKTTTIKGNISVKANFGLVSTTTSTGSTGTSTGSPGIFRPW